MFKEANRQEFWFLDYKKILPDMINQTVVSHLHYGDTLEVFLTRGIEGETFEYDEDGIPQWIPEAFSSDDLAWTLQRFQGINLLYNTPGYTMFSREYVMCADSSLEIYRVWNEGWDDTWNYPVSATMTAEESEAYGAVMNDITTYVNETLGKIILGEASLDNWDSFIQSLYDMGIEDCIEYKQNALDRYNAR